MDEYYNHEVENETTDDESYWDDPYEEYIQDIESEGHSEMYFDFNDDDRPDWVY